MERETTVAVVEGKDDESISQRLEEGTDANDIVTHDTPTEVMETPAPIEPPQREVTSEEDKGQGGSERQSLLWS